VAFAVAHLLRLSGRKLGAAILYHRVGDPPGDHRRELVPKLGTRLFRAQVRHLRACYRLVRASELHEATTSRRRGGRIPVAITFDDDLSSHAKLAAPILERLCAPATFYLTGATLRNPFSFWWERLQVAVDRGVADPTLLQGVTPEWLADPSRRQPEHIHELGMSIQLMERSTRATVERRLAEAVGPGGGPGLPAAEVRALAESGFEIGFHTLRHDYLPLLSDEDLGRAMHEGRDELADSAGGEPLSIAYPHGGCDGRVADAARAAGFRAGYTVEWEAVTRDTDPLRMGRVEASFASAGHLAMHLMAALVRARPRAEP
jgi:peptidoglycan/xylan/chitin deacetylase (PgdA/CDA1 family)